MGYWLVIRDLAAEADALEHVDIHHPAVFQLNVGGMWRYHDAMLDIGMAYGPAVCPVRYPEPTDYGLHTWPDEDDPRPQARRLYEAEAAYLGQVGDQPGIPLWKLSSNDAWWIRPAECNSALLLAELNPDAVARHAQARERFHDWLAFLARATQHGGITVG